MQKGLEIHCWLVRASLLITMSSPKDMGTRWRGAFGCFMIMRPSIFKCDWSIFSIWNGVMGIQPIRIKYGTGSGKVQGRSMEKSAKCLGKVQGRSRENLGKVWGKSRKVWGKSREGSGKVHDEGII